MWISRVKQIGGMGLQPEISLKFYYKNQVLIPDLE